MESFMVKRIEPTPKDIFHLEHLNKSRNFSGNDQPEDYKNRVVLKPWGHEYLIFEERKFQNSRRNRNQSRIHALVHR